MTRYFSGDRGSKFSRLTQMFSVVCSECGEECEVPFRPTGDRPVLCSKCFGGQASGREQSSFRGDRRERSERRFEDKRCLRWFVINAVNK